VSWGEYEKWKQGGDSGEMYRHLLEDAKAKPVRDAKRKKIVKPHEFPWENSPHGLLKHLVNEEMDTRCDTVDAYMQIIPPGSKSGKHRQLAEQCVYVVEGRGYDLHIDCDLELVDDEKYSWRPETETKRFDWEAGDVVYVPPNTISQHFNADPDKPARIIVVTSRIYKQSGLNDIEQLETAPEYNANEKLTAAGLDKYLKKK
jgi:gentisate 1,2-dioxygenase